MCWPWCCSTRPACIWLSLTAAILLAGLALLAPLGWAAFTSGLALLGLIVAFDTWHKRNPLSPLLMAGCRVLVYSTAFLAISTQLTWQLLAASFLLGLYVVGQTFVAKTVRWLGPAIGPLPAGMALLDALLLACLGAWLSTTLALLCFGLTLFLQRYVRGT